MLRIVSWSARSGVKRALSTASGKRKLTFNELQSITQTINERLREEKGPQLRSVAQIPNVLHECQRKFDAGMELLNPIIEEAISKHGYAGSAAGDTTHQIIIMMKCQGRNIDADHACPACRFSLLVR